MAKICSECGFPRDKNHNEHCIARMEERKRIGFRPGALPAAGHRDRKAQAWDKLRTMTPQTGPRRG